MESQAMSYHISILYRWARKVLFREVALFSKRHPRCKKRPGKPPESSDALILNLVVLTYLTGLKDETAVLRHS
jgi:hypothetical protein